MKVSIKNPGWLLLLTLFGGLGIGILVVSCATIMHGTKQELGISSTPTGAAVSIDNQSQGVTPLTAKLSRKDHHIVRVEMAGYQPFEMTITRSTSGWVWGNIIFGGLIGLAVDAISGGLYKLKPEQVEATLAKTTTGMEQKGDIIYVNVVLKSDPSWEKIATLKPAEGR